MGPARCLKPSAQVLANESVGRCISRPVLHCNRRRLRPSTARAAVSDAAEGPMNEGNPALQENLVRMVRLQIGQEKVKESAEVERQKLQEIADQLRLVSNATSALAGEARSEDDAEQTAKEDVDRLSQLTKDRSTLAFGSALADINQEADQFEEILRKNRAKMEAASRELADWELQTARARNEGTFFKGLFKADILQQPSNESQAPYKRESSAQEDAATYSRAQPVATDAALKQSSKVLKYSFGFLSFALLGGAIGGGPFCFNPPRAVPHAYVLSGSATVALDGRNALLGLFLGYAALKASQYNRL